MEQQGPAEPDTPLSAPARSSHTKENQLRDTQVCHNCIEHRVYDESVYSVAETPIALNREENLQENNLLAHRETGSVPFLCSIKAASLLWVLLPAERFRTMVSLYPVIR